VLLPLFAPRLEGRHAHRIRRGLLARRQSLDYDFRVVPCPACKAYVEIGQPYCRCCRVVLRFEAGRALAVHPKVRPGPMLISIDLARERIPGMAQGDQELPNGVR